MTYSSVKIAVLFICSMTIVAGPVNAQRNAASGNLKFAVVNFQKIFREAAATKSIGPQVVKLKKSFEFRFKDFQKQLQAAEKDLQSQRSILSPEAYAQKQKIFKKQVNGVQRDVQTVQRMVGRAEADAYKKVREAFHRITKQIAKERSLQLIFPRSGLIHVDAKYDISNEVLKRLNKTLPTVKVNLPKAQGPNSKSVSPKKN